MAKLSVPASDAPDALTIVVDVRDGVITNLRISHAAPVGSFEHKHIKLAADGSPLLAGSPPAVMVGDLPAESHASPFVAWCERLIVDRIVAAGRAVEK